MPQNITRLLLDSLKPGPQRVEITDTQVPGLTFRLTPKGKATWSLALKVEGKATRHALGSFPATGIKEARAKASALKEKLRAGEDPRAERKIAKENTVGALLNQYIALKLRKPSRKPDGARLLARYASLTSKPMTSTTPSDFDTQIDIYRQTVSDTSANYLLRDTISFLKWVEVNGHLPYGFHARLTSQKETVPERENVLSLDQVIAIYQAADQEPQPFADFLKFKLLTVQRHSDVARMQWEHVDLNTGVWTQPATSNKSKRGHAVPLGPAALALLKHRAPDIGRRGLVFRTADGNPVGHSHTRNNRLKRAAKVDKSVRVGQHDARHVFATVMAEGNTSQIVTDRTLNHAAVASSPSAVARVYDRSDLLDAKRQALTEWEQLLIS